MARLTAHALIAACLPVAAAAQSQPTLLDLFAPDRILRGFAQTGIMALRTQMDVKYGDMDIDIFGGRVSLSDVRIWPLPDWDENGDCRISIDRLTLRSSAFDEVDRVRIGIKAEGVNAPQVCFPPDAGEGFAMAGLDGLNVPRVTAELLYHVPSSGASVHVHTAVTGAATVDLTADLSYIWFDGRDDMDEPEPVVFLRSATLKVENDGIWQAMKSQVPPEFTGDNAGMVLEGMLGGMLAEANSDAADGSEEGDPSALTEPQAAFIASLKTAWPAFLAAPETLVLETAIDGDRYLDFEAIEDDPREAFDAFRPILGLAPASSADLIGAELLRSAMGDGAAALSDDDRRNVGLALVTGVGAPRDVDAGMGLLSGLADAGDGAAAMAMSDAMETRNPAEAYRWALQAGASGAAGAVSKLDRLEASLGLAVSLKVQEAVSADAAHSTDALGSLAGIRDQAAMRFSGRGMARSYGIAAMWAMIGAAAGDAESADILAEIDNRVRQGGKPARAAWAAAEATASKLALEAWLSQDLASRFGG